jgi:hypothetical protein
MAEIRIKRSGVPGKVPTVADLALGELAINTYDGVAFIKKNEAGVESVVTLGGANTELQKRYSYTATNNQTTFAAEYTAPFVDVYLNGVRLSTTDFTASNGVSVVLNTGATAGDLVQIIGHKTFSIAEALPLAGGTLTGPVVFAGTQTFPGTQNQLVSGTSIKTVGGESLLGSGNITISSVTVVNYTDRANLRSIEGPATSLIIVGSLGVFIWVAGSTEPDDDETCFATASGRWLLYAAAWDLVAEYVGTELDWLFSAISTSVTYEVVITSLTGNSSATFEVTVLGAVVGNAVVVTPPLSAASSLVISAAVLSPNKVQVKLFSSLSVNPSGVYQITVIKGTN